METLQSHRHALLEEHEELLHHHEVQPRHVTEDDVLHVYHENVTLTCALQMQGQRQRHVEEIHLMRLIVLRRVRICDFAEDDFVFFVRELREDRIQAESIN